MRIPWGQIDNFMDYAVDGVLILLLVPALLVCIPVFAPAAALGWVTSKVKERLR